MWYQPWSQRSSRPGMRCCRSQFFWCACPAVQTLSIPLQRGVAPSGRYFWYSCGRTHFCSVLHRLKAHPRSLSLLGSSPALPAGSSSGVSSSFLCLCTSLATLSLLPTLGFLCDLSELKHKLEKDKPLGIAQAVLRSTHYGDSFLRWNVLILVLY